MFYSSNIVDIAKHKKSMIWNEFEDVLEEEGMRLPTSDFVAPPGGSFSLSQSADYNDARSATDLENMFQDFLKVRYFICVFLSPSIMEFSKGTAVDYFEIRRTWTSHT